MLQIYSDNQLTINNKSVENIWPEKIEYSLSITGKAVIFGTFVNLDFRLLPLLKGLKIGKIRCELIEFQEFKLPDKIRKTHRDIASLEFEIDDILQNTGEESGQDGVVFRKTMLLPKSLSKCVQDVD